MLEELKKLQTKNKVKVNYKNGEEYYNKIYLYFNALIAVSLTPFGYLLLLQQIGELTGFVVSGFATYALIVGLLLAMSALIYQGHYGFDIEIKKIETDHTLRNKLDAYLTLSLKKYFLFLFAGLIGVVGLYVTTSAYFIVAYILSVILLSLNRPTLDAMITDLNLSDDEEKILIDKADIE